MLRLLYPLLLGIFRTFPMVFPTVFPMNLFQVGIPYLLQRYGLAGDSAVQVMTTRPGGEGWENRGKKWGKTQNHGKMWGKTI